MHNLAIALKSKGFDITGSDDEIREPSRSRLMNHGLLPDECGWFPEKIEGKNVSVILGMHAKTDNPELNRALALGCRIYSYPEYLYEQTIAKKRVVIAGSHGKTTLTAMVIHVLTRSKFHFDFMVGSQIAGFENMVSLSDSSELAVFEGDEYLSSPLDLRSKFLHYRPAIALITGIAWDHINVFPSFEKYRESFRTFVRSIEKGGLLFYYEHDKILRDLVRGLAGELRCESYGTHPYLQKGGKWYLVDEEMGRIKVHVIGKHNMQNISGAMKICKALGVSKEMFYGAMADFPGTQRRLQVLHQSKRHMVYLDFAHSPSKVKATLDAVRENHKDFKLTVILELHTFSSLTPEFIPLYKGSLDPADEAVLFVNRETLQNKGMSGLEAHFLQQSFQKNGLQIFFQKKELEEYLRKHKRDNSVILFMSSGNFGGLDPAYFIP